MIHEIGPKKYHVDYRKWTPEPCDTVFIFDGDSVMCHIENGDISFPAFSELSVIGKVEFIYLFSIDEARFFMPEADTSGVVETPDRYERQDCGIYRTAEPRYMAFAAVTAQMLYLWYRQNIYCGSCGEKMERSQTERACICPNCGLTVYPKISPVVIVAVTRGEYLLVTRYRDRPYRRYALVAGFAEIGESLEDTVRREVFEETGVHVKNIRYYKSQPWAFTSTLLSGFYCDLDGDPDIVVDEHELSEAIWILRDDIPPADSDIALTAEMMEKFRTRNDI